MIDLFSIDIRHIVELGTQIATAGAIRLAETGGDDIFERVIGVAIVVYEMG